jgi:hypothetical protein
MTTVPGAGVVSRECRLCPAKADGHKVDFLSTAGLIKHYRDAHQTISPSARNRERYVSSPFKKAL